LTIVISGKKNINSENKRLNPGWFSFSKLAGSFNKKNP